ncbi:MAG: NAD-dependent epimerase/dehydratase family protein [Bacteroidia bacterium]|nr:NAD-dependent epimerase/dehydratase family protein [Bacteroidia bacterium]
MSGNRPRIVITGGLGYLGQRIAHFFSLLGADVVITTRGNKKLPKELSRCTLHSLDLSDYNQVLRLLKPNDVVIHLAAPNEIEAGNNVQLAFDGTVIPTYRLLKAGEEKGIKQLIYFSTFHVYGKTSEKTITEETLPAPNHPYSISHKAAEDFCLSAQGKNNITTTVIRLSNAFGAPVSTEITRWTLLVNDLCRQAAADKKIVLNSYGNQLRDFVTIDRVCNALDHMIQHAAECAGVFHVGGETLMSIYEMAQMVQESYLHLKGNQIEISRGEYGRDHVPSPFQYSNAKLRSTGFTYPNDVRKSVEETLRFCIDAFSND